MDQEKIGKFISKLRKEKKLTQEDLAEKLHINSKSISRWETGKCMPDISLLIPLSEILDISVQELITGEEINMKEIKEKTNAAAKKTIKYAETEIKKEKKKHFWLIVLIFIIVCITFCLVDYHFIKYGEPPIFMFKLTDDQEQVESYIGLGYKMTRKVDKYLYTSEKENTYVKFGTWFYYHKVEVIPTEPNYITLNSPLSKRVEARRGSYCWLQNNRGSCVDTIPAIEMSYSKELKVSGYEKVTVSNLIGEISSVECISKPKEGDKDETNYILDINLEHGKNYIIMPKPDILKDIYILKINVTSEYGDVWYSVKLKK